MSSFLATLRREPALVRGALTALAVAAAHLLVLFGLPVPDGIDATITGVVDAVFTILGLVWIRAGVSPVQDESDPH